jgi:hypothetical protein
MENKYHDIDREKQGQIRKNVGQTEALCHYVFGLGVGPLVTELEKTEGFEKRTMRMADFRLNMG